MTHETAAYRILKYLYEADKYPEFDKAGFMSLREDVTPAQWIRVLEMLSKEGYIEGVSVDKLTINS
jgi:hypothetical protein